MTVEEVDVLICGSGSAGLCAATYLAKCGIKCKILDSREGPLAIGQADGVQCRTVEIFESFGISEELLRESYHVLEVTFWTPSNAGTGITRTGRVADTQNGLSHQPHVILNQARVNGLLLEAMSRFNNQEVDYGYKVENVQVDDSLTLDPTSKCVTVETLRGNEKHTFRARYVLGCDGAHSIVRKSLGFKMIGDSSDSVWGVMDIYPLTNFPDIRKKVVIKSTSGSMLIVPREGGELVRFYIELPAGTVAKDVSNLDLLSTAREIINPYTLDVAATSWWSAYAIGQRVADHFTKNGRVFLTGDACHTHSPKAGQGMNTSLQDGYNLGWKLATVLKGQAGPELLCTYAYERGQVARNLIEFDREFARNFSSRTKSKDEEPNTGNDFTQHFIKSGVYTAGFSVEYQDSMITSMIQSDTTYAKRLVVGTRMPSAQVVRFCDARAIQIHKTLPSDGRWRVLVFAGNIQTDRGRKRIQKIGNYLDSKLGPNRRHTPVTQDIDSVIEPVVIITGDREKLELDDFPGIFWPRTGKWNMRNPHKIYVDEESHNSGHGHAYEAYGIDKTHGAIVVVRPDQHITLVTTCSNVALVGAFFERVLRTQGSLED